MLDSRPGADAPVRVGGPDAQSVTPRAWLREGQGGFSDALVDDEILEGLVTGQLDVVDLTGAAGPGQTQAPVVVLDGGGAGAPGENWLLPGGDEARADDGAEAGALGRPKDQEVTRGAARRALAFKDRERGLVGG